MEQELILQIGLFVAGLIVGVVAMLIFNKVSTGSGSPGQIKREMDDYQAQVESHFEETSKKFKDMTDQYQDLYQHLSVGATTLCRPENVAPGLADQSAPNTKALPTDVTQEKVAKAEKVSEDASAKTAEIDEPAKPENEDSKA